MFRTIQSWLAPTSDSRPAAARLALEVLDQRDVPSVTLGADGTLAITGTNFGDTTTVTREPNAYRPDRNDIVVRTTEVSYATGRLTLETRTTRSPEAAVARITYSGRDGNDRFTNGTALPCVAHGDGHNDVLNGGGGSDTLRGGTGDDTLDGGDKGDVLDGGSGNDTLSGGAGTDVLLGGDHDDTLMYSMDGIWGQGKSAGGQWLTGRNLSFDVFDGGYGNDSVVGTDDADAIILDDPTLGWASVPRQRLAGIERIDGRGGDDLIDLSVFTDPWTAAERPDFGVYLAVVEGGSGRDVLVGNPVYFSDLYGGEGSDTLIAGNREDYLDGGTGDRDMAYVFADRYWVNNIDEVRYL